MPERWIRIRGGGRIRIDPGWANRPQPGVPPLSTSQQAEPAEADSGGEEYIELAQPLVERMEMRVESVFRPQTPDVEVVYVLTGKARLRPDLLHGLPTDAVLLDATTNSALPDLSKMIELIQRERSDQIGLFIEVHTHPSGIASPSEADRIHWKYAESELKAAFPETMVLFGIHAVSQEAPQFLERVSPKKEGRSRVSWRSYTRDHEFALFTANAEPYGIRLYE